MEVPVATPKIAVTMPDNITLFDRTPLPARSKMRKFYFRAAQPTAKAEVRFALPSNQLTVPITIWDFEDLRMRPASDRAESMATSR